METKFFFRQNCPTTYFQQKIYNWLFFEYCVWKVSLFQGYLLE